MSLPNGITPLEIPSELPDAIDIDTIISDFCDEMTALAEYDRNLHGSCAATTDRWPPEGMDEAQRHLSDKIFDLMVVCTTVARQLKDQLRQLPQWQGILSELLVDLREIRQSIADGNCKPDTIDQLIKKAIDQYLKKTADQAGNQPRG